MLQKAGREFIPPTDRILFRELSQQLNSSFYSCDKSSSFVFQAQHCSRAHNLIDLEWINIKEASASFAPMEYLAPYADPYEDSSEWANQDVLD